MKTIALLILVSLYFVPTVNAQEAEDSSESFAKIQAQMKPFFVGDYQVHTCEVRLHEKFNEHWT